MTTLEKSEVEVLNYLGLTKLPAKSKTDWTKAVVKVVKADRTENYAIATKNDDDEISIVKDWGSYSAITAIITIYPLTKKAK